MKTGLLNTLADKDWLSLSSVGQQQKSDHAWNQQQECSGSINNLEDSREQERRRKRLSALKKWETALARARGSNRPEKWLSLSIPGSSSCSDEFFIQNNKRKATPEQQEEEERLRELYLKKGKQKIGDLSDNSSQYKRRLPSPEAAPAERGGWLEVAFHMGVTRPELYLSKRVTRSDAKPEQHRFQLTKADINKAAQPLQQLAEQSHLNAVPVKVLDKEGNRHDLILKHLQSSHTYRFMGVGYTNFLSSSKLKENEVMSIWGLPAGSRGVEGENWLAFVN